VKEKERFPNAVKFGHVWMIPESDLVSLPKGRKPGRPKRVRSLQRKNDANDQEWEGAYRPIEASDGIESHIYPAN